MDLTLSIITAKNILGLFLMLCVGIVGAKSGILNKERCKVLSNMLINLIMPITFFCSFQQDFDKTKLIGLGIAFLLGLFAHVFPMLLGKLFFKKNPSTNWTIDRFCVIYGNCAYIGIPLIQSILGQEGVFYVTAFILSFNIFVFTQGVNLVSEGEAVSDIKHQILLNPVILSIVIGLICYLLRLRLPEMVLSQVQTVGNCNTPLAMIIAGCEMTETNFRKILRSVNTYIVTLTRLVIVPLAAIAVVVFFGVEQNVGLSTIICAAAPVGTMATVLSVQYDKDSGYSSGIFAFTTLLCVVTLPVIVAIYSLFL